MSASTDGTAWRVKNVRLTSRTKPVRDTRYSLNSTKYNPTLIREKARMNVYS
ncbi:hypothetical protein J25TS5_46950 [Paenibacillus faecis]|nr:hypothetical protein J25TS5_46950 [Paenibacillus faecis]